MTEETALDLGYNTFTDVQPEIGETDDYEGDLERLNGCYERACKGTAYTIVARVARKGEAQGLYAETARGSQILGYSIRVPSDIEAIQQAAWGDFCAA